MNERIKELAEQAKFERLDMLWHADELERFADLVRQDEREACARVCEDLQLTDLGIRDWVDGTYDCAKAIRVRGVK